MRDNPGQWAAYTSRDSCVVIAGPGSGKTRVVTVKIARILDQDVRAPQGIACITYSNECVNELYSRLGDLGVLGADNLFVGTVHSFCLRHLVIPFAQASGLEIPSPLSIASPREQGVVANAALAQAVGANERWSDWERQTSQCRRAALVGAAVPRGVDERAPLLARRYVEGLRARGLLDFEDIVLLGIEMVRNPRIRRIVVDRFPVLVVDEYQDLGWALDYIVRTLLEGGIRLIAVGDPDQSIYGFTGAQPHLLEELSRRPGIERVTLGINYRAGPTLVHAAEIALGEKRGYEGRGRVAGTIDIEGINGGIHEQADRACEIIREAMARDENRVIGEVAILVLNRSIADVVSGALTRAGIAFVRLDKGLPYERTPLTAWLGDCASWCNGGWATGKPRLSVLLREWRSMDRVKWRPDAIRASEAMVVQYLLATRTPELALRDWLAEFKRLILDGDEFTARDVEALEGLVECCQPEGKLADATLKSFAGRRGSDAHVTVVTLHSAKGLEFKVVIMPGMDRGAIPYFREQKGSRGWAESRRLFYVGVTRAKEEVHLLYSKQTGPSVFVQEIGEAMIAPVPQASAPINP